MIEFEKNFRAVAASSDFYQIELNPPASEASISELAEGLGFLLPPGGLAQYLGIADGETPTSGGMFNGERLLSCDGILAAHDWHESELGELADSEGHFSNCPYVLQGRVWRPTWIPIVFGHAQTSLYVDTTPSKNGVLGQVILSAQIEGGCGIVASSIGDLFVRAREIPKPELLMRYPMIDPNTGQLIGEN